MRKVVFLAQLTLDGRIAKADETFWEPFAYGEAEQAWTNEMFRRAGVWALGRRMYDAIIPWWDAVASGTPPDDATDDPASLEFARIQAGMRLAVFSRSLTSPDARTVVLRDEPAAGLAAIKAEDGTDVVLSCGPELFATLSEHDGLIDELLLIVHPAVITGGKRLFDALRRDLALRTVEVTPFETGAIAIRYAVLPSAG